MPSGHGVGQREVDGEGKGEEGGGDSGWKGGFLL